MFEFLKPMQIYAVLVEDWSTSIVISKYFVQKRSDKFNATSTSQL